MVRRTTRTYDTAIVVTCPRCKACSNFFRATPPQLLAVVSRVIPFNVSGAQAPWRASLTPAMMNYWSR
jgi:hypothetical protein